MTAEKNDHNFSDGLEGVLQIVNELAGKSVAGNYIYRGETRQYRQVSSSLFRGNSSIATQGMDIEVLQESDLYEAKRYTHETDDTAILTELQHYGGHTNLIDFTTDYLIALFFACDGNHLRDGRVVLLDRDGELSEHIFEPKNPVSRVLAQKSVFVRPPTGHIEPDAVVTIPRDRKQPILEYLQKGHGISTESIYNDLHGFIRSRSIHREAVSHLNSAAIRRRNESYQSAITSCVRALDLNPRMAMAYQTRGECYVELGDNESAVQDFTRVLGLIPNSANAYFGRSVAHYKQGNLEDARSDLNRLIEINPRHATAHSNRGNVHIALGDADEAIADCVRAIEISPQLAAAYNTRGIAYHSKGDFEKAIEDYERAIEFDPRDPIAYGNLGEAWLHLSDWGKARANLIAAKDMGADIATSFHNDYESVHHFEEKYGLTIPSDIADMLALYE